MWIPRRTTPRPQQSPWSIAAGDFCERLRQVVFTGRCQFTCFQARLSRVSIGNGPAKALTNVHTCIVYTLAVFCISCFCRTISTTNLSNQRLHFSLKYTTEGVASVGEIKVSYTHNDFLKAFVPMHIQILSHFLWLYRCI